MNQKRVIGLDVFRSNAILLVLACHGILQVTKSPPLRSFASCLGFYGVEQFFVLSGFLIGSILLRDFSRARVSFATVKTFWIRRWYRTLPNYYAFLLLNVLVAAPWHHHIERVISYPFFLQNFAWDMPAFFAPSWSLSIEEWFYLLFPLSIFVFFLLLKKERLSIASSLLLFLLFPFLARAITSGSRVWSTGVHVVVIYRLDAIAIGVALAYLRFYHSSAWPLLSSRKTMISGVLATVVVFFVMLKSGYGDSSAGQRSGLDNAITYDAVDFCFALILPYFSMVTSVFAPLDFIFTWVSILSYSLYLSNMTLEKPLGAIWALLLPYTPGPLFTS
jgi:peptidoglycan/LPS O-acetylase OafA/YrhL